MKKCSHFSQSLRSNTHTDDEFGYYTEKPCNWHTLELLGIPTNALDIVPTEYFSHSKHHSSFKLSPLTLRLIYQYIFFLYPNCNLFPNLTGKNMLAEVQNGQFSSLRVKSAISDPDEVATTEQGIPQMQCLTQTSNRDWTPKYYTLKTWYGYVRESNCKCFFGSVKFASVLLGESIFSPFVRYDEVLLRQSVFKTGEKLQNSIHTHGQKHGFTKCTTALQKDFLVT